MFSVSMDRNVDHGRVRFGSNAALFRFRGGDGTKSDHRPYVHREEKTIYQKVRGSPPKIASDAEADRVFLGANPSIPMPRNRHLIDLASDPLDR